MRKFVYIDANTIDEAASALGDSNAYVIAGGTDLLGTLKDDILPDYPDTIVNIKTIPGLDDIKEEGGILKIGALALLEDIANNEVVKSKYTALAEAAHRTASPHIREMGTLGGNICQMNRCWYFRSTDNRFDCIKKGGGLCYALLGDNRYHSIFGGIVGCVAINPSDMAPALVVLNATIKTNKRDIAAEDFWKVEIAIPGSTILEADEIVTEIQVPAFSGKSAFIKFAMRNSIDFPIVNCAAAINDSSTRICLNAVFNNPYRATKAEESIAGKTINEANAEAAGSAAVSSAVPLPMNRWKVQIAKVMVKRAILACA